VVEFTEADQLAADGIEIELAGAAFRLHFDFGGLRHVERAYGSLDAFLDAVLEGAAGQQLGMLEVGLTACLQHAKVPAALLEQMVQDALGPPMDFVRIADYGAAVKAACFEARLLVRKPIDPPADGEALPATSPGSAGTTSPPSASAEATESSGG